MNAILYLLLLLTVRCASWHAESIKETETSANFNGKAPAAIPSDLMSLIFGTDYSGSRVSRCIQESLGFVVSDPVNDLEYCALLNALVLEPPMSLDATGIMNLSTILRVEILYEAADRSFTSTHDCSEIIAICFLVRANQIIDKVYRSCEFETPHHRWIHELRDKVLVLLHKVIAAVVGIDYEKWNNLNLFKCDITSEIVAESERILREARSRYEREPFDQRKLVRLSHLMMKRLINLIKS